MYEVFRILMPAVLKRGKSYDGLLACSMKSKESVLLMKYNIVSYFSGCLLYLQWHKHEWWQVLVCSLKQDLFTVHLPSLYFHWIVIT